MDINVLKQQAESAKKLFSEINNQNRIFGELIDDAMMGAKETEKPEINKIQMLTKKAINLAKQGKLDEAQTLIKNYRNGN
tara:strand:- start:12184 stop:12423 length:240 start_codon:yes stop_codon:yes gene_type:complete